MKQIDEEINADNTNIYAEDAFNKISDKITLQPFYYDDNICMEIDTIEDLKKAREMLTK